MTKGKQAEDAEVIKETARGLARYDYGKIAVILLDARLNGIAKAAQEHGVTVPAITQWRELLKTDEGLKKEVLQKNKAYSDDFAIESAQAIKSCLDYINRAAQQADVNDKAMVRAIAGAMKMAGEFRLALDITYSSLGRGPSALPAGQSYELAPGDGVIEGKFTDDVQEITEEE